MFSYWLLLMLSHAPEDESLPYLGPPPRYLGAPMIPFGIILISSFCLGLILIPFCPLADTLGASV